VSERVTASAYMAFAKLQTGARFSLATSGVVNAQMSDIGPIPPLALNGGNPYGWAPLLERIAGRFGVGAEHVVTAVGTAFANHLAFAALIAPGDEVVVETPVYPLLTETLAYLGAVLKLVERRAEDAWRLDPVRMADAITPRTRLVVLTNLHNPTGARASTQDIAAIAASAARVGAMVLVDEVYLELAATLAYSPTAFTANGNIVVTSSLTKAYGLSGLRCGWVLAPADLALRMWRLNDLFGASGFHPGEQLNLLAMDHLDVLRGRTLAILEENRAAYRAILEGHPALDQVIPGQGTTVFPRLLHEDGDALFRRLKADYDTAIVPGRFFGAPAHIRVGLCAEPVQTREALERLAKAISIKPSIKT
jgi:aspartate/methionine/tyrosine aminotransferase